MINIDYKRILDKRISARLNYLIHLNSIATDRKIAEEVLSITNDRFNRKLNPENEKVVFNLTEIMLLLNYLEDNKLTPQKVIIDDLIKYPGDLEKDENFKNYDYKYEEYDKEEE